MTASRPLAAASFALLALLLTGCAAGGSAADAGSKGDAKADAAAPAADQSKEEACGIMLDSLDELQSLSSIDQSDPAGAVEALKGAEQQLADAAGKIANTEVKPAADGAAAALTDYAAYLEGAMADPANADLSALGDQITAFSEGIAKLGTVCA